MTRYTLHVPSQYNDGAPVPRAELALIENHLLSLAGGFTSTEATGAWRSPDTGRVYREPVQLYHVDTDEDIEPELREVAVSAATRLEQEAIYLTAAEVDAQLITTGVPA